MSDAFKACDVSVGFKSSLELSECVGEKRMVTVEIVVIAFKLTSRERSKEKDMMVPHLVIACCLTVLHNIVD